MAIVYLYESTVCMPCVASAPAESSGAAVGASYVKWIPVFHSHSQDSKPVQGDILSSSSSELLEMIEDRVKRCHRSNIQPWQSAYVSNCFEIMADAKLGFLKQSRLSQWLWLWSDPVRLTG